MDNVKRLPLRDFTRFCMSIAQVPSSYVSGLTMEEQLLWLCSYLTNEVIPTVNNNGQAVEELQNLYKLLKDYVDNYFDNLDIQEEVNNKLEEMAESGELAELISQYLEAQAVIGFNTNSSLAEATNLANGSFARTYGKDTYNDGKGAFYKIRTRINADVPDGDNIIVLTETENLVAEKIPDYRMNQVETRVTNLENLNNKKWLVVGDSYSQGYSPDGNTTSWSTQLRTMLGLDTDHYIKADYGGASFGNSGAYLYNTILQDLSDDDSVTDILIAGGYNDITMLKSNIVNGIATVKTTCATKFPNAKVHCAFIGGTINDIHGRIHLAKSYYIEGFTNNNIDYYPNLEYVMFNEGFFASDGIHPNQEGQNALAKAVFQAIEGEYSYSKFYDLSVDVSGGMFSGSNISLHLYSNNNISYLSSYSGTIYLNSNSFNLPNDKILTLGQLSHKYGIVGTEYYNNLMFDIPNVIIHSNTDGYFNWPCKLFIDKDGYVKLYVQPKINDAHNNYQDLNSIVQLQIPFFTIIYPTDTL